jgi:hypothetical protein
VEGSIMSRRSNVFVSVSGVGTSITLMVRNTLDREAPMITGVALDAEELERLIRDLKSASQLLKLRGGPSPAVDLLGSQQDDLISRAS